MFFFLSKAAHEYNILLDLQKSMFVLMWDSYRYTLPHEHTNCYCLVVQYTFFHMICSFTDKKILSNIHLKYEVMKKIYFSLENDNSNYNFKVPVKHKNIAMSAVSFC